jgi:hypothetical protein
MKEEHKNTYLALSQTETRKVPSIILFMAISSFLELKFKNPITHQNMTADMSLYQRNKDDANKGECVPVLKFNAMEM